MMSKQEWIESCVSQLKAGILTEERLRETFAKVATPSKTAQQVLYLITKYSSLNAEIVGMSLLEDGVYSDSHDDFEKWPYKRVVDAINDGWRVVQFPRVSPVTAARQEYVPNEFILEKMKEVP